MRANRLAVMVFLAASLLAPAAHAATFSSVASGDWNNGSTWNQAGAIPGSTDAVIINDGHTITVTTVTDAAQTVSFGSLAVGAALNVNPAAKLTLGADLNVDADMLGSATVDAGGGAVIVGGNINIAEGSTGGVATLRIGIGSVTATGSVSFTSTLSSTNTKVEFYGPGMLTLGGSMGSNGTLTNYTTAPGSTVKYSGSAAQTAGDYTYQNLAIANTGAGGVTVSTSLTVNGTLGIQSSFLLVRTGAFGAGPSSVLQMAANTYLKLGDAITGVNVPMPSFGSYLLDSTSTIYYGSGASQTINSSPPYANLDVVFLGSAGSPIKQIFGNTSIAGNLLIDQQPPGTVTLDIGNYLVTVGGTLSGDGALTFGSGEIKLAGNNNHTGTFTAGAGIFTYEGGSFQNVRNTTYNHLVITGTNTNATVSASGGTASTLTVETDAFFDINNNFTVDNLLSVDGTINGTGDLLTLSSSAQTISGSGDIFASVSSGTRSTVAAANLHLWGSLTVASGATFTNNGILDVDVSVAGTDGGSVFTNASNATLTVGGFLMTTGVLNAFQTGNTISYDGLGQTIYPTTYHHLILTTTPAFTPGLKTLAAFPSLTVNGDFTLSGAANFTAPSALDFNGDFSLSGTATFDAGASFTHTVAGDWSITGGTFTPNTSNITFNGAGPQTISASPFHHVWFDNTGSKSITGDLDVSGDVAVLNAVPVNGNGNDLFIGGSFSDGNNTFTGIGTATMDGTGAHAINDGSFANLISAKTGGGSILLGGTVNVSGDFHLQSGTFAIGSDLLDVDGNFHADTGTTFALNSGSLKVAGNLVTDGTVIPSTGTLTIEGSTAVQDWTGSAPPTIHNLTVTKTAGTLDLDVDVTVNGFLNLDAGMVRTGDNKLALTNSSNLSRFNGSVFGELDLTHTTTGAHLYPMGSALGYSPVTVTVSTTGQLPIRIADTGHATVAAIDVLGTYWIFGGGTLTGPVDLTFQWPNVAIGGDENTYVAGFFDGSSWSTPTSTVIPATNSGTVNGVAGFTGDWTFGSPAAFSALYDLELSTDGTALAGALENLTITAKDSLGNTITGYTGDHDLTFAGASASPNGDQPSVYDKTGVPQNFGTPTTLNFTNGVATTTMVLYNRESAPLQASDPALSVTGNQYSIDVEPEAASELKIVSVNDGNTLYANGPFTLSVEAHDLYGNYSEVATNTTVDISLDSCFVCTGSLSGTTSLEIPSGNVAANFSGLTYDVAEANVFLDATTSAGDTLAQDITGNLTFLPPAAGVIVTTANDNVAGSLREAIQTANSGACGPVCNITFDILPPGAYTLQLTSRLPAIEVPVVIDGTTQDGYTGTPILAIDGALFTGATGFEFTGGSSTLEGFILGNLSGAAVQLDSDSNTVQNCWIGTDLTGTGDAGNGTGISISGNSNMVGGTTAAARNVISGNITGIRIHDTASSNTIAGNYIGTNVSGNSAIPNTRGIWLNDEAISNTIGGLTASERNVISGNSDAGISLASSVLVVGDAHREAGNATGAAGNATGAAGNATGIAANGLSVSTITSTAIIGNYIGVGADGVTDLGNGIGVELGDGAVSNFVGMSGEGNVISGNDVAIEQNAVTAATNKVKANLIGYAADGTTAVQNSIAAILISAGNSMEIGGTAAADANAIANNGGAGVGITGSGSAHTILGNAIPSYGTIAIDLGGDGLDTNDPGDPDPGPNTKQNSPDLLGATLNGGNIDITASLSTTGVGSTRIEVFKGSGGAPVAFVGYTCIGGGTLNSNIVSVPNTTLSGGDQVVTTATSYSDGSCANVLYGTSEVSNAATITCPAVAVTITGVSSICAGSGPFTLDAGAGFASYLWSTGATSRTISVTPGGTTNYSVTVTDANGCPGTDGHTITVNPLPTPVITGPSSACDSATLTAPAGYNAYFWSTGATTQSITVTSTGVYSVTVTDANSCQGSASHSVTITGTPASGITVTGSTTFCQGGSVDLTSAPAPSYLWSTGETTQTITVSAGGSYSVTTTNGSCSATSSPVVVTVNPNPVITVGGPATACGSALLSGPPGYASYLWSTGATTQNITVTSTGTYTLTVTDANGCQGSDTHGITINTSPVAAISGPVTACDNATLDAGVFASYLWSTGETTQTINVTTSGIYSVTVTDANGCTASDTHNVTVTSTPAPVITGPTSACDSAVLDAGTGYASYLWSTGETTRTITVTTSGTYSVTVTGSGCTGSDSHAITVDPSPVAVITGPASACDSATLDAGPGFAGYLWSTGETTQAITVTTGGIYSVTVTGAGGCQASDTHTVTINSVPPPTITGPTSACDSAVLDAGAGYTGYLWSTGETTRTITVTASGTYSVTVTGAGGCTASDSHGIIISNTLVPAITGPASACDSAVLDAGPGYTSYLWSTGATTQTITVTASGTYSVTVTGAGGCTGSDSHGITIDASPVPTITGPASACGSALLDAGPGYNSYLWSTGETTQTITVTTGGTYGVTVTGAGGCTGTDSHGVAINSALTPAITGPTSACDSAVLDAGAGFQSYLWSTGETTQTITVTTSGTYSVTVTGAGGCTGSDSHGITIGNTLTPAITGPTSACDRALLDAGAGYQSYLWSTGETTQTITVTTSGTYSVTVTGAGGCTGSDSHGVTIGGSFTPSIAAPSAVDAGTAGHQASVPPQAGATYVWGISGGSITGGQGTSSITFKAGAPGTLNLTVSVTLNGCTGNDAHTVTVNAVSAPPDVKIVKSGPSVVQAGAQFSYGIDVINLGSVDLSSVTMVDTLPAGVVVTGVAEGTWDCSAGAGSVRCDGAFLPANGHRTITITVNAPQQTGFITNTATVNGPFNDPTPANNTSSVTTEVTEAPVNCSTIAPALVAPADNATTGSPVTFSWNGVPGAFEYELWLVTGGVPQLAGTTAATTLTRALPSGTSAWYVVARFPGDCTPTVSAQRTFTVEQGSCGQSGAPQLTFPTAGSLVPQGVTFSWRPVPLAIGYRVWIEANGTAAQDVGVTGGAITLDAELPPGAIVAYVDALFSGCPPVRSNPVAFTVGRPDPCAGRTAAQPLAPANNATLTSSEVLFSWLAAAGADAYRLFVSVNDAPFILLGETVETSLEANVPAGSIRWRVEAVAEGCASIDSQESRFTLPPRNDCSTAAPQPLSPANGSTTASGSVTFSWTAVPNATAYEVWLGNANGSPALIGTAEGTSLAHVVSAGELEWFVRARGDRCPSRDSAPFTFTYTPADACANNQRPVPVSPLADARVTSPVAFEWTPSPGAVSYELFAFRGNVRTAQRLAIVNTSSATVDVPAGRLRWFVRANFNGCSPLDSQEEKLLVVAPPAACAKLDAPFVSATGQVSSGVPFKVRWTLVPGATSYQLQLASNPQFSDAQTISTSQNRFELTRTNDGTAPIGIFARVRAIDSRCRPEPTVTPYGPSSAIFILPSQGTEAAVPLEGGIVRYRIPLGPELAGQTFTVVEKEPWLSVDPTAGVVPAGGTFLNVTADATALPLGTSLGAIRITLDTPAAGSVQAHATTVVIPTVGVSKSTPVIPSTRSEPPPDALIIPAVAHATGINAQFQSDVRVTNSSAKLMNYEVTFTPSGDGGLQAGKQTHFAIEPGSTIALDDVLKSWFGTGGESAVGVLEIRPLADVFGLPPVSSAPFAGLTDMVTFASSRTFNTTANGTFGQYIPAIPYASFIGRFDAFNRPTALSLQQIAQSPQYRTNLGLVEASGEPVSLLVSVFGDGGAKLLELPVNLAGGQHTQLNGFLAANGIDNLNDGRVEVSVLSPGGKVTAYASVLDNSTNDPLLVTPVTLSETGNTKWVMPGVADVTGVAQWQTDMRVFNAGTEDVEAAMTFISLAGGEPRVANVLIPAGEVRQFDRTLNSVFGITGDAGAIHISTPQSARLVATGRTYNQASNGTYGQFISAVTPNEAAGIESRPLQLLQVEESSRFRSNLGLAEVTGNPVTVELSFVPPDTKFTSVTELTLGPNEFRQLGSVLRSVGMTDTFNARITVRVIGGTGRVTAYCSVIDQLTNDPTYVPAQ